MNTQTEFHDPDLQRAFSGAQHRGKAKKKWLLPLLVGGGIALGGTTLALFSSSKPADPVQQLLSSYQAVLQQSPEKAGEAVYQMTSAALADDTSATGFIQQLLQAHTKKPDEFRLFERIRYQMLAVQGGAQEHQALAPANIAYVAVKDISGAEISVQRLDGATYTVATVSAPTAPQGFYGLVVQKISPTASTAGTMPTPLFSPSGAYVPSQQLQPLQPLQPPLLEQRVNQRANPTGGGASAPSGSYLHNQHNLYQPPTLERLTSGAPYQYATHRVQNR